MTGGQTALSLDGDVEASDEAARLSAAQAGRANLNLVVVRASGEEAAAHEALLEKLRESGTCVWDSLSET